MKKVGFILLVMVLSIACNITFDFSDTNLGTDNDPVGTTVALTLTSQAISQAQNQSQNQEQPSIPDTQAGPSTAQPPAATLTTAATATPTLTPTLTLTTTPTATPTLELRAGEPDKRINFSEGKSGFYDDDDENTIITPKNGTLEMVSTMKVVGWHGWSMYYHEIDNFYLESTINVVNCGASDEYGMVFRGPDYSSGYFFGLTCGGKYFLDFLDGKYKPIIVETPSQFIHTGSGQTNRLGVLAEGEQLTLYINDQKVQQITDPTYTGKGVFGVFIAAYQTPNFTIQLDEIAYWLKD